VIAPTIGTTVHYVSYGTPGGEYGKRCRAAIVTEVSDSDPEHVGLMVANPGGLFFHELAAGGSYYQDPGTAVPPPHGADGGSWHWPERVPDPTQHFAGTRGGAA
jgi:hypothetical protein